MTNPIANIDSPAGIAVDGNGNIWFANSGNNSVTELQKANNYAATTIYNGNTKFSSPNAIAIDSNNNVWVANPNNNSVTELTASSGYSANSAVSISGGTTGFNAPVALAIDSNNNIWIASPGNNSVTELTALSGYSASGAVSINGGTTNFSAPSGIAIDSNGNVWVENIAYWVYAGIGVGSPIRSGGPCSGCGLDGNTSVTELMKGNNYSATGAINVAFNITYQISTQNGIAVDSTNNIYNSMSAGDSIAFVNGIPGDGTNQLIVLTSVNSYASSSEVQISGGTTSFSNPQVIAVDGVNNIWVANKPFEYGGFPISGNNSVTELTKASNYTAGSAVNFSGSNTGFNGLNGIAVDESGNVWVTSSGSNTITELVGAAAPTPFSVPLK